MIYNWGSWPNKICDYVSLSRPTVSNPCSDIKHLFERHEIRLLAEWNEEDFANKIVHLLEEPNLAHRLGEEARRISVYEYSWPVLVERLEGFYWHVMEDNKRIAEMVGESYGTT
jgi:glycosyltransferase involved in cell wall biosynthesis